VNWDDIRKEYESTDITLKALAEKYDIKIGTLKSRKSRDSWNREPTEKVATPLKKVATKNEKVATQDNPERQRNRSGNPNPPNQFTKRNTASVKHGFFSKYLPQESLDIMEEIQERSPVDMVWDQIMIQYTAIIRAQKIMFVEDQYDTTKEIKKEKSASSDTMSSEETEWEIQFAWDKHATFLNAQSRAMSELRGLIKQFEEMAHIDDERRLRLEGMRLGIEKTKAEVENLSKDTKDKTIRVVVTRKKVTDDE
jgi:uncharacterized protein YjcR